MKRFGGVAVVVVVLLGVLLLSVAARDMPSPVYGTYTFYSGGAITETTYSNAPYIGGWGGDSLEVFISADSSTTGTLTATVQVSFDNVNWVDLTTEYLAASATDSSEMTGTVTTDVITSSGTLTATSTAVFTSTASSSSADAWTTRTYAVTLSDIVSPTAEAMYFLAPIHGLYMRVKLEVSAESSGTVTPVVRGVRR